MLAIHERLREDGKIIYVPVSDQLILLSSNMNDEDHLHEKVGLQCHDMSAWLLLPGEGNEFFIPFSAEEEMVIGCDKCLCYIKGRKETLLLSHF